MRHDNGATGGCISTCWDCKAECVPSICCTLIVIAAGWASGEWARRQQRVTISKAEVVRGRMLQPQHCVVVWRLRGPVSGRQQAVRTVGLALCNSLQWQQATGS